MSASTYNSPFITASFPAPYVLLLSLSRSPVNALHTPFWLDIGRLFNQASSDPQVRCVILASSVERAFTAGLDLHDAELDLQGTDPARTALLLRKHIRELQDAVSEIERCDKPVVVAIHGICFGGGVDLAIAGDVRYAAANSVFAIKEVDVGLAADVGSLQRLPAKVASDSHLRELAFTARNFDAPEALHLGLVSRVVPGGRAEVLAAALETARMIAAKSPVATLATKQFLNFARDHSVQDGLEQAQVWNMAMLQADDLRQSIEAFATKRAPTYSPLAKL